MTVHFKTVDEYFGAFPKETQLHLQQIREAIQKAAPKAVEVISYNMPAFKQNGILVYFAAYKNHIGFYPTASGIKEFQSEFKNYNSSKGAVQFPIDKKMPLALIQKIVKFRVQETEQKAVLKKILRTCKNRHQYYKSSDCPTCPQCEKDNKPSTGFLSQLSAPALRALENKWIKTLKQLSTYSENEILALHGMGPSSMPVLKKAMSSEGLKFKSA